MTDIAIRVENLSKQYPSTGSGQAASAALRQAPGTVSQGQSAQDRPAGALQDDPRKHCGFRISNLEFHNPQFDIRNSFFHPELTERENVYLNGVILGIKR